MTIEPQLSVVVAIKGAKDNLPRILEVLRAPHCEVLICVAGEMDRIASDPEMIVMTASADALVPHLWRDGIRAARAPRIALTTAECVPSDDWIERMAHSDITKWAGVGGVIANDPSANAANWAVFFLRYSAFAPPREGGPAREIAADNAVYDRAAILACDDLLAEGFWEPSFHRRFRDAGRKLLLDPAIVVTHHGRIMPHAFARQRMAHGREYGEERALRGSRLRALALLACSPVVPLLILLRIVRRVHSRPDYRRHLSRSTPWLLWFALAWSAGEATGYACALAKTKARRGSELGKRR